MAISDRFRKVIDGVAGRAVSALRDRGYGTVAPGGGPRELSLQASIPNPFSDVPLFRLNVHVTTDEHTQGESLRLRAHLQTQLVIPPATRAALPPPETVGANGRKVLMPRTRRAASGLVQRGLRGSIARKVTPYLERRFESWIDVQASTRPLDQGAQALLPEPVQALGLGRSPLIRAQGEPQIETWAGRCEGERQGFAQVTVLQFNETERPPGKRRAKRQPLHLAASVASFYEDEVARKHDN